MILFSARNDVVQSSSRSEIRADDQCLRRGVLGFCNRLAALASFQ